MTVLRHRSELAAYLGARGLLRALPHRAARPLGAALGRLAAALDRRHGRIARENLARAFPGLPSGERGRIATAAFRHFGAMIFDAVSFSRFDAIEVCRRLTLVGWEHAEAARREGRGAVFVSAHLGNWEICSYPLALYSGPAHAVARPFPNPLVWQRVVAERERLGQRIVAKQGAAKALLRALRRGETVGLIVDQRVRPGQGIVLPFFGHPALTTPLPAQLALRQRAPVVPIFAFPEPGGRYRVEVHPALPHPSEGSDDERIAALTREILAVFEREIAARPEQWLWLHRRWRLD